MSPYIIEVFPWNKNFETGITVIDAQHKQLVALINKLANALVINSPTKVTQIFTELSDYASFHFEEEERIWNKYFEKEDTWSESHLLSHSSFLPNVLKIQTLHEENDWQEVTESILQFLIRWMAFHILDEDKQMSFVIKDMQNGLSFEEAKLSADKKMRGSTRILIDTVLSMYDNLSSHAIELIRERNLRANVENELIAVNKKLENLCITDELTGLYNRRYYNELVEKELNRAIRSQCQLTFISIDLDHFKKLNDSLGHNKGDEALQATGQLISRICKRNSDFAFRMGGEEFLIVVTSSDKEDFTLLAEKIRSSIADIKVVHDSTQLCHDLTASLGIYSKVPVQLDTSSYFLEKADNALYQAKQQGRNQVVQAR